MSRSPFDVLNILGSFSFPQVILSFLWTYLVALEAVTPGFFALCHT